VFKKLSVGVLVVLLTACGAPRPRQAAPQNPGESASRPGSPPAGRAYRIDESRSELRILVYRAGPLARFGHNHVVVNRSIRGTVNVADAAGASEFRLDVPVAAFVVDDAQARREEGADFAAEVPEDAKSGTLRNMLGTAVLDGDEFPTITLNSLAVSTVDDTDATAFLASVAITVAGHESKIDVPFRLESDSRQLSAKGSLELRQSAIGLAPYSLMMGALQVQDAMTIKFDIVATES
jgi:YceI-like domain